MVRAGSWSFRGFVYLNANRFHVDGVTGAATTFVPPGEPFQDADQDGQYDAGERWVNLAYAATPAGTIVGDVSHPDGTPVRDAGGLKQIWSGQARLQYYPLMFTVF